MKKLITWIVLAAMLAMLASSALGAVLEKDMYVYTKNGKNLYVRSSMSTKEDNIVGSLKYGTKVHTYGGNWNGWTMIDYGDGGDYYVMWRYLVEKKPEPYHKEESTTEPESTKNATTVAQMNSLVSSPKFVTPYEVYVRPTRASGWVYMRWFPSKNAESAATFPANYKLQIIAELKDWYQVYDPDSGRTGFVYQSFVN